MTEGGSDLKKHAKSKGYLFKIVKITKFVSKKLEEFYLANTGSILIEFAVCMPVLIILLYYINDLSKLKRYYDQTEFAAQQMVNILQNIAKTKKIEVDDIKRAASLAYLTIYPETTMYSRDKKDIRHGFFYIPRIYMFYVKGESGGKASTKWGGWINTKTTRSDRWGSGVLSASAIGQCVTKWGDNVPQSNISPTLTVEEGKAKIILEVQLSWNDTYENSIGKKAGSAREAFGFYFVNPKKYATAAYFPSVVIFTPNSGFTKDIPQR